MRRLSLLGVLLGLAALPACAGEQDAGLQPGEESTSSPTVVESDTPSPDPTAPVAGDHRLGLTLSDGVELAYRPGP